MLANIIKIMFVPEKQEEEMISKRGKKMKKRKQKLFIWTEINQYHLFWDRTENISGTWKPKFSFKENEKGKNTSTIFFYYHLFFRFCLVLRHKNDFSLSLYSLKLFLYAEDFRFLCTSIIDGIASARWFCILSTECKPNAYALPVIFLYQRVTTTTTLRKLIIFQQSILMVSYVTV